MTEYRVQWYRTNGQAVQDQPEVGWTTKKAIAEDVLRTIKKTWPHDRFEIEEREV